MPPILSLLHQDAKRQHITNKHMKLTMLRASSWTCRHRGHVTSPSGQAAKSASAWMLICFASLRRYPPSVDFQEQVFDRAQMRRPREVSLCRKPEQLRSELANCNAKNAAPRNLMVGIRGHIAYPGASRCPLAKGALLQLHAESIFTPAASVKGRRAVKGDKEEPIEDQRYPAKG